MSMIFSAYPHAVSPALRYSNSSLTLPTSMGFQKGIIHLKALFMRNQFNIKQAIEIEAQAELQLQIERERIIDMLNQVFWEGYAETLSDSEIRFYMNQYRE